MLQELQSWMYDEPACLLPVDCLGLGLNGERHLLGWQPALRGPVRRRRWRGQTRRQHAAARLAPSLTAAAIAVSAAALVAAIAAIAAAVTAITAIAAAVAKPPAHVAAVAAENNL